MSEVAIDVIDRAAPANSRLAGKSQRDSFPGGRGASGNAVTGTSGRTGKAPYAGVLGS